MMGVPTQLTASYLARRFDSQPGRDVRIVVEGARLRRLLDKLRLRPQLEVRDPQHRVLFAQEGKPVLNPPGLQACHP
jgi:hypothetical protein